MGLTALSLPLDEQKLKARKTKSDLEKEKNEKKTARLVEEILLLKKAKKDASGTGMRSDFAGAGLNAPGTGTGCCLTWGGFCSGRVAKIALILVKL